MALHEVQLKGYSVRPGNLSLGTFDSYGIEQLHVTLDDTWSGLAVTATFNPPEGEPVEIRVPENGLIDVPAEATANAGTGTVVYCGVANGVQRITKTQGYNVFTHGNVGTTVPFNPSESLATQVLQAALNAEKNSAEAKTAAASAVIAAANSAAAAKSSENAAANSATAAKLSENAAATSEDNARISAGAAAVSEGNAAASADKAKANKTAAEESEKAAAASAVAAAGSAAQAEAQKTAAAKSASDAQGYMQTASGAATAANASAENAAGSKAAAGNSASAAARSEQAAWASEEQTAVSERAAKESADAAAKSAQAALESKTAAETSEGNAATSAKKAQDVADSLPADYVTAMNDITTLKQQVKNITPDDSAIGGKPWSSKNIVDMLCPEIKESGNPVLCYPVVGYPLGVKASWEPMQEGSGTPYPAGGGKNQLNPAKYEAATKTINGITFTRLNTGEVIVNGTATGTAIYVLIANFSYPVSLSTDRNWSIAGENVISAQGLVSGVTVIRPSDNTSLYIRVQSGETVKTTVQPQIEKGSTSTAWEPYENIRPIKGRDSVTVERCGENLVKFPYSTASAANKNGLVFTSQQDGSITVDGTATADTWYLVEGGIEKRLPMNTPMALSGCPAGGSRGSYYIGLYLGGTWFSDVGKGNTNIKLTTRKIRSRVEITIIKGTVCNNLTFYPKIEVGTTITPYSKYQGSTNTLTLPETVYGGEVDAVTGTTKSLYVFKAFDGTEDLIEKAQGQYAFYLPETSDYGICSHFKSLSSNDLHNGVKGTYLMYTIAAIFNTNFASVDEFKSYLRSQAEAGTPVQICYTRVPGAANKIITATGAQPIPALAGVNTVLTDADSETVTGRADPIKRIEDLEAAVASIN
jgi:hypothetical protein